jgi:hypothetical protein
METKMGDFMGMICVVAFWLFLGAIILGPRFMRYRERTHMQEVLKTAYERGQPVPPELVTAMQSSVTPPPPVPTRESDLRRGIVLIFAGIGIMLLGLGIGWGIYAVGADEGGYITGASIVGGGAIPTLIGVAYLVLWSMGRKSPTGSRQV